MVHLSEIDMVVIESTASYISSYLLAMLAEAKIPVVICDLQHNPVGQYFPLYGAHDCVRRVKEQIAWDQAICDEMWRRIVVSKICNQAAVLRKAGKPESEMLLEYAKQVVPGDKTNREGHAAKVYFNALFGTKFSRDNDNAINAQLNYGYSILLAWVNREIVSRGYLTQLGIAHRNEFNQFNLACDFMEPFRPAIDAYVVTRASQEFGQEIKVELLELFSKKYGIIGGRYELSSIISLFVKAGVAILSQRMPLDNYLEFSLDEG